VNDPSPDWGSPIAYLVLEPGTPVYAGDETYVGTVGHVLFVPEKDIFDGIVVQTDAGERFVDADRVEQIYERRVITSLTADDVRALRPPKGAPPVYGVDPSEGSGKSFGARLSRLFRRGKWSERPSGEQQRR
jgi:hypothetical protein